MNNKFKIGRYYKDSDWNTVFKYIDKEDNKYFFRRVDGGKYSEAKCDKYRKSSKLCQKCTTSTSCSRYECMETFKEVPKLKAILLYGE